MRTKYIDLIDQTFDFPQDEFNLQDDRLIFHGIDLGKLIEEYGTPLKFNYLPQISHNIQRAKGWFREAMNNLGYSGKYHYSYCTKVPTFHLSSMRCSKTMYTLKLLRLSISTSLKT